MIGYAPMCENMPSGAAIRPSDVLTMYGGKRVEVLNTDAEGRLILADALVRALEDSPDYIVDVATLTGAQLVALGARTSGGHGQRRRLPRAASSTPPTAPASRCGRCRCRPSCAASLDSDVADISNMGDRYGGMLVAGLFLQDFVADGRAVGPPRHRRPGVQPGRGLRLHAQGRHRARRRLAPSSQLASRTDRRAAGPSSRSGSAPDGARRCGSALRGAGPRPHPRRVAPYRRVVDRDRVLLGERGRSLGRPMRRRVHSPSAATRTTVVSVTTVAGST